MKKITAALLLFFCLSTQTAFAGWIQNPFTRKGDFTPAIEEEDGSPSVNAVKKILVSNGSLTDNGGGEVVVATSSGSGDVVGPASSTDNAICRFDSTTGKLLQNSTVTVDDSGNFASVGTINTHTVPGGTGTFALSSDISTHAALTTTHGVSGNIVGTTDTQTLTNKTLTTPSVTLQDGNGSAPTADGQIKYDRTTERLQVGDGSSTRSFVPVTTQTDTKYCTYDTASLSIVCNSTVSSSSPWTDSGTVSYLTDTTDELVLGGSAALSSAKFSIDGDADQIQSIIQGHSTQTSPLQTWETSAGTDVAQVLTTGFAAPTGTAAAPYYNFVSNPTTGMFLNSTRWGVSLGGNQIIQCLNDSDDGCHIGTGNASSAIRLEVSPASATQNGFVIAAKNVTTANIMNVYDEALRSFFRIDGVGGTEANILLGDDALATTATDGFTYMPTTAGTPTGTPTTYTGMAPFVYDSTNNKFCVYDGGWLCTVALI